MDNGEIRKRLVEGAEGGNFLASLYQLYVELKDRKHPGLLSVLTEIHNEENIDLIREFSPLEKECKDYNFFELRSLLSYILPDLLAEVDDVVNCVEKIDEGEQSRYLYTAIQKFCEVNENRCDRLIEISKDPDIGQVDHLRIALVAGAKLNFEKFFARALDFIEEGNIHLAASGIDSVWRFDFADYSKLIGKAFYKIESLEIKDNDWLNWIILRATENLVKADNLLQGRFEEILKLRMQVKGPFTRAEAADLLNRDYVINSDELFHKLLDELVDVGFDEGATLNSIDCCCSNLIKTDRAKEVISFLERLFLRLGDFEPDKVFASVRGELKRNPIILSFAATKWFLLGDRILCEFIVDAVGIGKKGPELKVDLDLLIKDTNQLGFFVARKAIGWLLMRPASVVSYILSIFENISAPESDRIEELLFNPVLISDSDEVNGYFDRVYSDCSMAQKKLINRVKKRYQLFHEGLNSASEVKEMELPASHYEIGIRRRMLQMEEIQEKVYEESFLSSISQNTTLLHGNRWLYYKKNSEDELVRSDAGNLQQYSESSHLPLQLFCDPYQFDSMLRVFKAERIVR